MAESAAGNQASGRSHCKVKIFQPEKSIKRAESREKMLDKIEVLDKPVEENVEMHLALKPRVVSGNDVLTVKNLAKAFPQQDAVLQRGFF